MDGVQLSQSYQSHYQKTVFYLPLSPQEFLSWYSFHQQQKDERLSLPWSHPVVLPKHFAQKRYAKKTLAMAMDIKSTWSAIKLLLILSGSS